MKKLLFLVLLAPLSLFGQIARYDMPVLPTTPHTVPVGSLPTVLAVTNATVSVCNYPATIVSGMCTNKITTYTDSTGTTACPSTAQLTAPGSSVCTSTTGLQGALGFWYGATSTHITYTVKTPWGAFGPYDISPSIGAAGNPAAPGLALQFANSGASAFQADSNFTWNPTLHVMSMPTGPCMVHGWWNVMCSGATGNGTTDDSTAFQAAATYGKANGLSLYMPTGQYLITKSQNLTATNLFQDLKIYGDGPFKSVIVHALTEAYPVIDFGGCGHCGLIGVGMAPQGGSNANSQATAGVFVSPGPSGAGSTGGSYFLCRDSHINAGASATSAALVIFESDLPDIDNCNFDSDGGGIIFGDTLGTATSVASKFYTMPAYGYTATKMWMTHSTAISTQASPIQLTGAYRYTLTDDYAGLQTRSAETVAGPLVEVTGCIYGTGSPVCPNQNSLDMQGFNAENPTGAASDGIRFDALSANSTLQGYFLTGGVTPQSVVSCGSSGQLLNSSLSLTGAAYQLMNCAGIVSGSKISDFVSYTGPWGSVGASSGNLQIDTHVNSPLSVFASLPAGIRGTTVCSAGGGPCTDSQHLQAGLAGNVTLCDSGAVTGKTTDTIVEMSTNATGDCTYTIPVQVAGAGGIYYFSNTNATHTLTLNPNGKLINGSAGNVTLGPSTGGSYFFLVGDGVNFNSGLFVEWAANTPGGTAGVPLVVAADGIHVAPGVFPTPPPAIPVRAGNWSIAASTTVAVTFATAMSVTPTCTAAWSTSTATTGVPFLTSVTTTGLTVNVPNSGTINGTYVCVNNNAN